MQKLFLALLITTTFLSCKKDKGTTDTTKRDLLTANGGWFETSVLTRSAPSDAWEVNYFSLEPCNLDNKTTFSADYTYSIDGGTEKCDPSDPQMLGTGTYSFTDNDTHLSFVRTLPGYNQTQDWTIIQLDANSFIFEYYYPVGGPYYKVTMTH